MKNNGGAPTAAMAASAQIEVIRIETETGGLRTCRREFRARKVCEERLHLERVGALQRCDGTTARRACIRGGVRPVIAKLSLRICMSP